MCSKPVPTEAYQDLSDLMEILREESTDWTEVSQDVTRYAEPNPAHDYGWAGVRTFYGLLENV